MELLTTTILSGILYDCVKHGITITTESLRTKLKDWIVGDETLEELSKEVNILEIEDFGERKIEQILNQSIVVTEILERIKSNPVTNVASVIQSHTGSGDNVCGNKITNQNKSR